MTEVTRSPELYLGKRRSADCDTHDIEVENPNHNIKRYRVTTKPNGLDGLRHGDENSHHAFKRNKSGSFAAMESVGPPSPANHQDQLEQYYQSVIASMKIEHQMALTRKDQETQQLNHNNQQLMARCQAMTQEHNSCLEEGRVLKRAVAIQESRFRELSATHEQLQNVMRMAAEHIAKLENENRELNSLVSSFQYGGPSGFPPGPPDVY
mmetsp:Transcript_70431/g.138301  ORF Transcript_70431/g.138301 Transcript_70431/m.138301 type:complete len:209 (+) Transcript_70431:124-750(+)